MEKRPTKDEVGDALRTCGDHELKFALDHPEVFPDDVREMLEKDHVTEKDENNDEPDPAADKKKRLSESDGSEKDQNKEERKNRKRGRAHPPRNGSPVVAALLQMAALQVAAHLMRCLHLPKMRPSLKGEVEAEVGQRLSQR